MRRTSARRCRYWQEIRSLTRRTKTVSDAIKAPFPWFGGKRRAAHLVWARFGVVRNYVEPFAGSLAVLLGNPNPPSTETINDLDCYLANFWRAVSADPDAVAAFADQPVNEADLHARHQWLVNRAEFRERMKSDPDYFDAKIAGWWVWGISCWIGGGWCKITGRRPERRRPAGKTMAVQQKMPAAYYRGSCGVHAYSPGRSPDINAQGSRGVHGQMPRADAQGDFGALADTDLSMWFDGLRNRLRRARVICGDWSRVLTPTPLGLTDNVPSGFVTGVMLDPPYDGDLRDRDCYAVEGHKISGEVRAWALAHGDDPRLRIALCGYQGEHEMPDSWECVAWKAGGGYANQNTRGSTNSKLERIWFSPHCLQPARDELQLEEVLA